jgi:Flp pilus assembly protein TadD
MLLGDLEYGVQAWDQAIDAYTAATQLEPDEGRAWLMLGASEVRRGRREQAAAHLQRAATDPATATQARSLLRQLEAML